MFFCIQKSSYKIVLVDKYHPGYSSYSSRSGGSSTKQITPKVIIANLNEQNLQGICLCFIRISKKIIITFSC